jgi:hypothetical protein
VIRYLIAKYVDDLTRNEPINVGVIVLDGADVVARFDGEDDARKIDLRRVRNRVTGSHSYRAWVDYWRTVLESPERVSRDLRGVSPGDSAVVSHLLEKSGRDFYIEQGGTIVFDVEAKSASDLLEELFARLVRQPDPEAPPSLREKSKEALRAAGAPLEDRDRFQEHVPVEVEVRGVTVQEEVSYAVMNGYWNYLQVMPFDPAHARTSRKEASHCAFLFEHSDVVRENGVILYDQTDLPANQYRFLELLMALAPVVNVNDTEHAAEALQGHLNLG